MSDPDGGSLYEQATLYQQQLAARDAALAARLVERYGEAYVRLAGSFDALALEVAQDVARGQVFTIDRLRRLDRYALLMQQVDAEIETFSQYAAREIGRQQATEVQEALRTAQALRDAAAQRGLLDMPADEGRGALPPGADERRIEELFARIGREPYLHLIGTLVDGMPLYEYLRRGTANVPGLSVDVIEQIRRVLEQALLEGWNPRKAAQRFREAMGVGLTRALRIARTEMMRSYREASRYSYIAAGLQYWEWSATMDLRTCLACALLDGEIFPVNEPMHSHVNCRCVPLPVVGEPGKRERRVQWPEEGTMVGNGRDWFNSLTDEQKREWMGIGNYNAWKSGAVKLDDFIQLHQDPVFGPSYVEASLLSILGDGASQYYGR